MPPLSTAQLQAKLEERRRKAAAEESRTWEVDREGGRQKGATSTGSSRKRDEADGDKPRTTRRRAAVETVAEPAQAPEPRPLYRGRERKTFGGKVRVQAYLTPELDGRLHTAANNDPYNNDKEKSVLVEIALVSFMDSLDAARRHGTLDARFAELRAAKPPTKGIRKTRTYRLDDAVETRLRGFIAESRIHQAALVRAAVEAAYPA